jgi:hypothetical protein
MSKGGSIGLSTLFLAALTPPLYAGVEARWSNPVSGNWQDAAKWSTNPSFPSNGAPAGTSYDAVIDASGSPYVVTIVRDTAVDGLTLDAPGATLTMFDQGALHAKLVDLRAGTFDLGGNNWLSDARVQQSGGTFKMNGRLDNVTLAMSSVTSSAFLVRNTLTLEGTTIHLVADSPLGPSITSLGAITLAGAGRILFDGTRDGSVSGALTIESGVSIEGGTRAGTIGSEGSPVLNRGTIVSSSFGLTLAGDWDNQGTIRLNGGPLTFGGNITPAKFGRIERAPSQGVSLSGRLDLQGGTFDMNTTVGSINLVGSGGGVRAGTIANGTLTSSGSAALTTFTAGALENVALDVDVQLAGSGPSLTLDGVTLNNRTINLAGFVQVIPKGVKPIGGTGELVIDGRPNSPGTVVRIGGGESMVIGPGITVRTDGPTVGAAGQVTLGNEYVGSGTLRNEGAVLAQTPGMTVEMKGDWENAGLLKLSAGRLLLGGRFTPAGLGNFQRTGGTVALTGLVDARGQTLRLDKTTGSWDVEGRFGSSTGRINGGRVEAADGAGLNVIAGTAAYLDGVTLAAPMILNSNASLRVFNSPSFDAGGSITMNGGTQSNPTLFDFTEPTTIGGTGEIVFDNSSWNNIYAYNETGPVTFGPGVTLRVGTGGATIRATPTSPITIQGSLITRRFGQTVLLQGPVDVTGLARAEEGSFLVLPVLSNLSGGTLSGGELDVRSGAMLFIPGSITVNRATIRLSGSGSGIKGGAGNALAGLTENGVGATLSVTGGASLPLTGSLTNGGTMVVGGTVSSAGDFAQGDGGELRIQLGASLVAHVLAAGNLAADGVLGVDLLNNYVPVAGSHFDVLDFATFTGAFDGYDLPTLPAGLAWDTSAVPTTGMIAVVPEPSPGVLIAAGAAAAMLVGRRRRPAQVQWGTRAK